MHQKQVSLEEIYNKLLHIERALKEKGIILEEDEGELTDEFKAELEKRRKSKNYIPHEEVKMRILSKK